MRVLKNLIVLILLSSSFLKLQEQPWSGRLGGDPVFLELSAGLTYLGAALVEMLLAGLMLFNLSREVIQYTVLFALANLFLAYHWLSKRSGHACGCFGQHFGWPSIADQIALWLAVFMLSVSIYGIFRSLNSPRASTRL